MPPSRLEKLGALVAFLILILGVFNALRTFGAASSSVDIGTQTIVLNAAPTVSDVLVNSGDPIILAPDATTSVQVSFTISDPSGCGDIFFSGKATTTLYRSSAQSTSTFNYLSSYIVSTSSHNCPSATSSQQTANATATLDLYYFADATDASSSYSSDSWLATVDVRDASYASSSATSTAVELYSLLALKPSTSSLDYGSVSAGQDTGSNNFKVDVQNAGNVSSSLRVSGTNLAEGGRIINVANQHLSDFPFTYGGGNQQSLSTLPAGVTMMPRIFEKPMGGWATTTPLVAPIYHSEVVVWRENIYLIGGQDNSAVTSTIWRSSSTTDRSGNLTPWQYAGALPTALHSIAAEVYGDRLYVMGGSTSMDNSHIATSSVWYADLGSDGSIGSWMPATTLPETKYGHRSFIFNGKIYITGGCVSGCPAGGSDKSYAATVLGDGSLGSWVQNSNIPYSTFYHGIALEGSEIYITGGCMTGSCGSAVPWISKAAIDPDGTIGSWSAATPTINAMGHSMAVVSGKIYILGGSYSQNTSLYSPVGPNTVSSRFNYAPSLVCGSVFSSSLVNGGYMYIFGGGNEFVTPTSSVQFASIPAQSTYWGVGVPGGTATGTFSGTVTFTSYYGESG